VRSQEGSTLLSEPEGEGEARPCVEALEQLGFRVTLMTSKTGGERFRPDTPEAILREAEALFTGRKADDTVVFAFSGLGGQLAADGAADQSDYIFPTRSRLTDKSTLLPVERLFALAARSGSERKLILLDHDRSPIALERPQGERGLGEAAPAARVPIADVTIELDEAPVVHRPAAVAVVPRRGPPGTVVFLTSQPGEHAYEIAKINGGVFTHHVVRFLRGYGPPEAYPDGEASVAWLVAFVREATEATCEQMLGMSQTPQAIIPMDDIPAWSLGMPGKGPIQQPAVVR
jgi:hypothetical protein